MSVFEKRRQNIQFHSRSLLQGKVFEMTAGSGPYVCTRILTKPPHLTFIVSNNNLKIYEFSILIKTKNGSSFTKVSITRLKSKNGH